jgi:hypothetical protein
LDPAYLEHLSVRSPAGLPLLAKKQKNFPASLALFLTPSLWSVAGWPVLCHLAYAFHRFFIFFFSFAIKTRHTCLECPTHHHHHHHHDSLVISQAFFYPFHKIFIICCLLAFFLLAHNDERFFLKDFL